MFSLKRLYLFISLLSLHCARIKSTREKVNFLIICLNTGGVRTPIALHCGSVIFNIAVKAAEISKNSVKVRPFLFPFTIGKYNLIYSECLELFFVRICRVFYHSQGQTQALFLACYLRPVLEKVKFVVRHSLKPFKDLFGHFDPSSTALTKRAQTRSNCTNVLCILSDSV